MLQVPEAALRTQGTPTLYLFNESFTPQYTTFLNSNFIGIASIIGGTSSPPVYTLNTNGAGLSTATNYSLPVGTGYLCFFRGNGLTETSAQLTNPAVTAVTATVSTTGSLMQGQVIFKDWYTPGSSNLGFTATSPVSTQGFNLAGNPYASAIDLMTFQTTTTGTGLYGTANLASYFYELNPITHNYETYYTASPSLSTSGASRYVASGEGFLALAGGTGAQLIFNETAKANGTNATVTNNLMAKRLDLSDAKKSSPYFSLQLAVDSINTSETIIGFNASAQTGYVFNEDAPYKSGTGVVSLSSASSDNLALTINQMPLPKKLQTVKLNVYGNIDGNYTLTATRYTDIPFMYDIWLKDAYMKDSLDMRHNAVYTFNILHADTNSFGKNRFSLVFRKDPGRSVHLLQFLANKIINAVKTTWTVENEENYTAFSLQKSTDGVSFATIDTLMSTGAGTYSFTDQHPQNTNYYKLQMTDVSGSITYSAVVPVMYSNTAKTNNNINIYPNPTNGMINIAVNQGTIATSGLQNQTVTTTAPATGQSYDIKITNMTGEVLKTVTAVSATWQNNVSSLLPGTYIIQVLNHGSSSVVGRTTFVKL